MISLDTRDVRRLERSLMLLSRDAFPRAVAQALNKSAFTVQTAAKKKIRDDFILKNNFTIQSIRVDKVNSSASVQAMQSEVGSATSKNYKPGYMDKQEFGATKRKNQKIGIPLLTSLGAGLARGTRPRNKLALRAHLHRNLNLIDEANPGKTRRQKNAIRIKQAALAGMGYVYLENPNRRGIYQIHGSPNHPHVIMIWDLTHPTVRIPKHPWLKPSTEKVSSNDIANYYIRAMKYELRKGRR